MLEESLPSIWASMNSWFTPAVLFVVLNLMIGTIAITSSMGSQKLKLQPQIIQGAPSFFERLKSIDLYRYRSEISDPPPASTTADAIFPASDPALSQEEEPEEYQEVEEEEPEEYQEEEEEEEEPEEYQEEEEEEPEEYQEEEEFENPADHENLDVVSAAHGQDNHVTRSKSDMKPLAGEMPVKLPKKMRKSASAKSAFGHFEEEDEAETPVVVRPSTMKEGKKNASDLAAFGDDEEVDAKADDFINRFKQQLKLQRLDSFTSYKEMISRGASK